MVYVFRAIHVDGVTGTFTTKKNTLCEAKEIAKSLREMGLWVIIIGLDGKTIEDETKEDPRTGPKASSARPLLGHGSPGTRSHGGGFRHERAEED
jgi:hypothetical protein